MKLLQLVQEFNIRSSDVKLDLNGFTIFYTGTNTADGIYIPSSVNGVEISNVEITNGTIKNFSRYGIYISGLSESAGIIINNLRIYGNSNSGIVISKAGYIIEECCIFNNDEYGICASGSGMILKNIIADNGLYGIFGVFVGYRSNVICNNLQGSIDGVENIDLGENLLD